jgi:hypothetical protein
VFSSPLFVPNVLCCPCPFFDIRYTARSPSSFFTFVSYIHANLFLPFQVPFPFSLPNIVASSSKFDASPTRISTDPRRPHSRLHGSLSVCVLNRPIPRLLRHPSFSKPPRPQHSQILKLMFLKGNLGCTDYGVSLAGMIHALTSLHSLLRT